MWRKKIMQSLLIRRGKSRWIPMTNSKKSNEVRAWNKKKKIHPGTKFEKTCEWPPPSAILLTLHPTVPRLGPPWHWWGSLTKKLKNRKKFFIAKPKIWNSIQDAFFQIPNKRLDIPGIKFHARNSTYRISDEISIKIEPSSGFSFPHTWRHSNPSYGMMQWGIPHSRSILLWSQSTVNKEIKQKKTTSNGFQFKLSFDNLAKRWLKCHQTDFKCEIKNGLHLSFPSFHILAVNQSPITLHLWPAVIIPPVRQVRGGGAGPAGAGAIMASVRR